MHGLFEFISRHGYFVLLAWVLTDQLGVPLPAFPLLLAAGALAGAGRLSLSASLLLSVFAAVIAEGLFAAQGARGLLLATFVPRLERVAPPLAGIFHMRFRRCLIYDALGAALWAGSFLVTGFLFSRQVEIVERRAAALGRGLILLLAASLAAYLLYKIWARQRFLRELRISRITPAELKQKIDAGEDLVIVDLRHSMDFEADPQTIPGAFRMDAKDLEEK